MSIAIYAGSFDPITNGHLDILKRGAEIFDKVIIAVSYNIEKKGFLPVETRVKLIKDAVSNMDNVEVDSYEGLTVEYAKSKNAKILLRGLRSTMDFEYELQLSQINKALKSDIQTVFLMANSESNFISSSMIRDILKNNGDISQFVPQNVCEYFIKYDV